MGKIKESIKNFYRAEREDCKEIWRKSPQDFFWVALVLVIVVIMVWYVFWCITTPSHPYIRGKL